ncbi:MULTISPECIES: dihydroneopterin aldolase [unclassified Halanaerobium]|uniref:dihydroneopterin aldolase n=1 Tax=unclassified Halanaerobium TaxID=2641197 RepID=UPI000DF2707B|nr:MULTISPECIES: dihydroneopterin aldolase [unclassified Halanaerobium]RCW48731.1 dihydroneopterin aldolase [Halanaerobium sp. MA284_MarDTE_T2]RCW89073.1 dihydroneopterin aldolase [Halanaerobium sp. DL-01]
MNSKDEISLNEMIFYGYHGALKEEEKMGQRFTVNFTGYLNLEAAAREDNLEKSVHYGDIFRMIKEVVENERFDLIEALGLRIIEKLFSEFNRLDSVKIEIKKPSAPIEGILKDASIVLKRQRSNFEK